MTVYHVVITCEDNAHRPLPIADFQRGYNDDPSSYDPVIDPPGWWRFDDSAAAGGGKIANGMRDAYDEVSAGRHVTRVHRVHRDGNISETVEFVCPHCGPLQSIRFDKCVQACERIASAEISGVSFAAFRKAVTKVG